MGPKLGQFNEITILNQALDKLVSFDTRQDRRRDATILALTAANKVDCGILGHEEF